MASQTQQFRSAAWAGAPESAADRTATTLVIVLIGVVTVRLHELIPGIAMFRPALLLSIGGLAFLMAKAKPGVMAHLKQDRSAQLVVAYFLLACMSVPFALWQGRAVNSTRALVPALALVLVIILSPPTKAALGRIVFGFTTASAILAGLLVAFGRKETADRLEIGASFDSNDAASLFATAVPMALGLALTSKGFKNKLFGAVLTVLLVAGVVKTGSRGGTIALAVATIAYVLGQPSRRRIRMIVGGTVGLAVVWTTTPASFKRRMTSATDGNDYNFTSYDGRTEIWKRGLGYIIRNPIVGVGIGNFQVAEEREIQERRWSTDKSLIPDGGIPDLNAHNAFIQATAELGIGGGIVLIMMILTALRLAAPLWSAAAAEKRHSEHHPEFFAAILAFTCGAIFLSHAYSYTLFTLAGLLNRAALAHAPGVLSARAPAPASVRRSNALRLPAAVRLRTPAGGPTAAGLRPPAGNG